jgi:acyl-CoA thioester hydrolase
MIKTRFKIRVRYADTDKMQFVYNGKYLEYFEVGRTELLRSLGLPYSEVEKRGYQLPLVEANIKYKSAAFYDDILIIESSYQIESTPIIQINYTIYRKETLEVIAEGFTKHLFIKEETKKAVRPPEFYIQAIKNAEENAREN